VSIIIPCYNAADTIAQTLASVRAQTYRDWEALCADDGSTDATPAILAAAATVDRRVRHLRLTHAGLSATRNRALAEARAESVFFLDADDQITPAALETLLHASRRLEGRHAITAGHQPLNHDGEPLPYFNFPRAATLNFDTFLRGNRIPPMVLVPRRLLGDCPFDGSLRACEDWDLWLRLTHQGVPFFVVPRVLLRYRYRAGSLSHKARLMVEAGQKVIDRWAPYAGRPGYADDLKRRWSYTWGAVALASGDPDAIETYFQPPPSCRAPAFCSQIAHSLHWAYAFVRGVCGHTWRSHGEQWRAEIRTALAAISLAACADDAIQRLPYDAEGAINPLDAIHPFLKARPDIRRLVVYGLGTNGALLVAYLRAAKQPPPFEIAVADDRADDLVFELLALPRVDPRQWRRWPRVTGAIITPNDHAAMKARLVQAGAIEDRDFVVLAKVLAARAGRQELCGAALS
jgi:hypothetical protein